MLNLFMTLNMLVVYNRESLLFSCMLPYKDANKELK